jgi:hypothetical protein
MQKNAFQRNGSSIHEVDTKGYQTSYVHHIENPVHFEKEIKVTIEHGHGNHLANEMSSVAYWYADKPTRVKTPPPVAKRQPVMRGDLGWEQDPKNQITSRTVTPNAEMKQMKKIWKDMHATRDKLSKSHQSEYRKALAKCKKVTNKGAGPKKK